MRIGPGGAERLEEAVARAEERTAAELVVVSQPFSGSYRDVELAGGFACALAFLAWALFAERAVPAAAIIPSMLVVLCAGWGFVRLSPQLRRALTLSARRRRQARQAARLAFLAGGVDATRARTGVLIHLSFLERTATLVADRGVREVFSRVELDALAAPFAAALRGRGDPSPAWCAALEALGTALGERLPRGDDDVNELDDAPRLEASP